MSDALAARILALESDFFEPIRHGPAAIAAFNSRLAAVLGEIEQASSEGTLSEELRALARSVVSGIMEHAQLMRNFANNFDEVVQSTTSCETGDSSVDSLAQPPSSSASRPLFRYFIANICSPYPDSAEKERVAEAVRDLGWHDFDKKKFEDWLNRKRVQSGYVAILRLYCDGDHEAMRRLCRAALHGTDAEKARLPDGALDDVEDMRDFLQSQHDELVEETGTAWVDELATGVQAIIDEDYTADHDGDDADNGADDNEGWASGDSDSDSDSGSDSASSWSETDVEDEEPPRAIIGAKRKLTNFSDYSPRITSRPPSRSLSMRSTSSSSSSSTACSLLSCSGSSLSSVTSLEVEDDDRCDRPAKRARRDLCGFCAESTSSIHSIEEASTTPLSPTNALFTTYQSKRKHVDGALKSRMRSIKHSRYAALGVASLASNVSDAHMTSLSSLCSLDWTPVEVARRDFDADSYTVDCTQPGYEESDDEDFAIFAREDDELPADMPAWSKVQIHAILRMLLSASEQPQPASAPQSAAYTYVIDVGALGTHDAIDFEEMVNLTPEALSAMFDVMNGLTPALPPAGPAAKGVVSADEAAVPTEVTAVTSPKGVWHSSEAPSLTQDVLLTLDTPLPAVNVRSPVLGAPGVALDIVASDVSTPVLSVDTSAPTLEPAPSETEEPLSPLEGSLSPTSSSSSEGDSPPALSDDSGSSSRSSSVGSDGEQDSLLMSPEALSADYSQLNDESLYDKASNAQASQFQVEYGEVPNVTIAAELSCASLLERYLNDQMTWA